jgi:hypothetical protein
MAFWRKARDADWLRNGWCDEHDLSDMLRERLAALGGD